MSLLFNFNCTKCNLYYTNINDLHKHMLDIHKIRYVNCNICNCNHIKSNVFVFHRNMCVKYKTILQNNDFNYFICKFCNKKFLNKKALRAHKTRWHSTINIVFCNICNEPFDSKSLYNDHMYKMHKHINVKCDICGKYYKNKKSLWTHKSYKHGNIKNNTNDNVNINIDVNSNDYIIVDKNNNNNSNDNVNINVDTNYNIDVDYINKCIRKRENDVIIDNIKDDNIVDNTKNFKRKFIIIPGNSLIDSRRVI